MVGLAGLGGQGQTEMLRELFAAARRRSRAASVSEPVALVAGDRQTDGIFPLWSIEKNITVGSLRRMLRGLLVDPRREAAMAETWREKINIRTPDVDNNILSLSGGNQQKALFARALGSDAGIVLMDDPMRGVDIGTKQEVYGMIRAEAEGGRTFIWYTTEMDELKNCDHVYVFRNGRIVADLARDELTEEKVLHSSFAEASGVRSGGTPIRARAASARNAERDWPAERAARSIASRRCSSIETLTRTAFPGSSTGTTAIAAPSESSMKAGSDFSCFESTHDRERIAVLDHPRDMECESLGTPRQRLVKASPAGNAAGEVREGDAVGAILFVDEGVHQTAQDLTPVSLRIGHYQSHPAWRKTDLSVPIGISRTPMSTVTLPGRPGWTDWT